MPNWFDEHYKGDLIVDWDNSNWMEMPEEKQTTIIDNIENFESQKSDIPKMLNSDEIGF